jgi:hypothetical protein
MCGDYSGFMLAARITLLHVSMSSAINLPKSADEFAKTVAPSSASRSMYRGVQGKPWYPAGVPGPVRQHAQSQGLKSSSRIEAHDFLSSLGVCGLPVRSSLGARLRVVLG